MQIPIPRVCEFSVLMAPSLQPLCEYTSMYELIILWTQEELLPWTESHSPPPVLRTAKIKIFQKYKVLWSLFQYSRNCWKLGVELSGASNMRNQSKGWSLPLLVLLLLYRKALWAPWHTKVSFLPCQGDSIVTPNKFTSHKIFKGYPVHSNVPDLNVS